MKKILFPGLLLAVLIFGCKHEKQPGYTISGTIAGADTGWVLLKTRDGYDMKTMDSAAIQEGKFVLTGTLEMPEMYYLVLKGKEEFVNFFLENSAMTATLYADSMAKSKVTGSPSQDLFLSYKAKEKEFEALMENEYKHYQDAEAANDTAAQRRAENRYDSVQGLQSAYQKEFILKNGKSVVSPYLAMSNAYKFNLQEFEEIDKVLDTSLARSKYVVNLKERIKTLTAVQPGKTAPDFSMNDTAGRPVSLASFRGKVVLVDFWASWCGPCRHENPNVVAAYKKFNSKGFDVLGVSLDGEKEPWIEAIRKDGLTWTQVSDLQRWNNKASNLYGVMSIPANFLLDKEGKIIASGLQGEELQAKIAEALAPPAK